jgi:hypothetical protein
MSAVGAQYERAYLMVASEMQPKTSAVARSRASEEQAVLLIGCAINRLCY